MIKKLLTWLFSKELAQMRDTAVKDAREVIEQAKKLEKVQYVKYDRMDINSPEFLFGAQQLNDNKVVINWLSRQKETCLELMQMAMSQGDKDKVLYGNAQIMLIDSLFKDLKTFKECYEEYLAEKDAESRVVASEAV